MSKLELKKEEMLLTSAEAVAVIKRAERVKGSRFYVGIPLDAHIVDKPDMVFPHGCYTSLELSKAQAMRMARDMLSDVMEKKGGRIRIVKHYWDDDSSAPAYWFN